VKVYVYTDIAPNSLLSVYLRRPQPFEENGPFLGSFDVTLPANTPKRLLSELRLQNKDGTGCLFIHSDDDIIATSVPDENADEIGSQEMAQKFLPSMVKSLKQEIARKKARDEEAIIEILAERYQVPGISPKAAREKARKIAAESLDMVRQEIQSGEI